MTAQSSGDWGEAMVADYLCARGFQIEAAKFRCRFGEIDLIARHGGTLCFVEVKERSNLSGGLPRESVTRRKQEKLRAAAAYYLSLHDPDVSCRFDVAEVYTDRERAPEHTRIEYLENAF